MGWSEEGKGKGPHRHLVLGAIAPDGAVLLLPDVGHEPGSGSGVCGVTAQARDLVDGFRRGEGGGGVPQGTDHMQRTETGMIGISVGRQSEQQSPRFQKNLFCEWPKLRPRISVSEGKV